MLTAPTLQKTCLKRAESNTASLVGQESRGAAADGSRGPVLAGAEVFFVGLEGSLGALNALPGPMVAPTKASAVPRCRHIGRRVAAVVHAAGIVGTSSRGSWCAAPADEIVGLFCAPTKVSALVRASVKRSPPGVPIGAPTEMSAVGDGRQIGRRWVARRACVDSSPGGRPGGYAESDSPVPIDLDWTTRRHFCLHSITRRQNCLRPGWGFSKGIERSTCPWLHPERSDIDG